MTNAKRTPGKWYVGTYDNATAKIWAQAGKAQIADPVSLDDARFIVTAVNCHDELVAALEHCLLEHGGYTIKGETERKARAALAKARTA